MMAEDYEDWEDGADRAFVTGDHREAACRHAREARRDRRKQYVALGLGREYDLIDEAMHGQQRLPPPRRTQADLDDIAKRPRLPEPKESKDQ